MTIVHSPYTELSKQQIELPQNIIKVIKKYMYENDISQTELARRMGKKQNRISGYLRGEKILSLRQLATWLDALNVTMEFTIVEK